MGVPSLFKWLKLTHPNVIIDGKEEILIDNLYLDFNAIIHTCVKSKLGSMEDIEEDLYDTISRFLDFIIQKVKPKKLLYISVDGVAPRAKINHQRGRRYKSALGLKDNSFKAKNEKILQTNEEKLIDKKLINEKDKFLEEDFFGETLTKRKQPDLYNKFVSDKNIEIYEGDSSSIEEGFDLNNITPGTDFMERLHKALVRCIQRKLSNDIYCKDLKIIYSSYLVPGEGEQKIMAYIRTLPEDNRKTHVIYSPDGDLIFLSLSLQKYNVMVMRDYFDPTKGFDKSVCEKCGKPGHHTNECGIFDNYHFLYVDIPKFKKNLLEEFKRSLTKMFNDEKIINDWIFLCSMLGNDFLPPLPCLDIRFNSIEVLNEILIQNYNEIHEYITHKDSINYSALKNFYKILASQEDRLYYQKFVNLQRFRENLNRDVIDETYEKILLHTPEGKDIYYKTKLNVSTQEEANIASYEYIKGLSWVYNYYINGITAWDWHYPHHFAPFAADLSNITISQIDIIKSMPLKPLEQLLLVCPPQSKKILPPEIYFIFDKFKDQFPSVIKTDMFDKIYKWMEAVILPELNPKSILKVASEKYNQLGYEVLSKNIKESDLLFTSSKRLVPLINMMYDDLKICCKFNEFENEAVILPCYYSNFPGDDLDFNGKSFTNTSIMCYIESKHQ